MRDAAQSVFAGGRHPAAQYFFTIEHGKIVKPALHSPPPPVTPSEFADAEHEELVLSRPEVALGPLLRPLTPLSPRQMVSESVSQALQPIKSLARPKPPRWGRALAGAKGIYQEESGAAVNFGAWRDTTKALRVLDSNSVLPPDVFQRTNPRYRSSHSSTTRISSARLIRTSWAVLRRTYRLSASGVPRRRNSGCWLLSTGKVKS
jgi:hypothetical protein